MKNLLMIAMFSMFISHAFAQKMNSEKLDSLFQILEQNDKFMGSIALSHKGKNIYTKVIGFADLESSKKADIHTKYRIGSISKMFTAALVFKAVEANQLDLNQTIESYFPKVKNADKITIGHLLQHRSGIHNFTSDKGYMDWHTSFQSKEKMLERIVNGGSDFEPNEKADYSNSNYVLLSYLLETIYNKAFNVILDEEIIQALKLKNTYFGGQTDLDNNECYSYAPMGKWKKEAITDMSIPLGAGALVSNPTDLNIFIEQLFKGNIISKEHLALMKTLKDGYGMGMFKFPYGEKSSYGHTGGIDGFHSMLAYFPEDELALSLISNGMIYDNNSIMLAILDCFYGKPFELPSFKTIELSSEDLDKYLGVYASKQIPIKITISKEETALIAQATGQSAFPLNASDVHVFTFDLADVVLEFNPHKKEMVLKQGGGEFLFSIE